MVKDVVSQDAARQDTEQTSTFYNNIIAKARTKIKSKIESQ